jgi:hypothetical protein
MSVVGVDIGGATTDVFSVFQEKFNRTVSANLGMSYSICNVLTEAGTDNILRWLPFDIDPFELRNRIRNKMIRPTTIPQTLQDLVIEQVWPVKHCVWPLSITRAWRLVYAVCSRFVTSARPSNSPALATPWST